MIDLIAQIKARRPNLADKTVVIDGITNFWTGKFTVVTRVNFFVFDKWYHGVEFGTEDFR